MNQSFNQLIDSFVNHVVDGMDQDTMAAFIRDTLFDEYCKMSERDLYSLVQEHAPYLLEDAE